MPPEIPTFDFSAPAKQNIPKKKKKERKPPLIMPVEKAPKNPFKFKTGGDFEGFDIDRFGPIRILTEAEQATDASV